MEGTGKASPGSRVTAEAVSASPGSSAGSHHFHCTIPTESIDNAHSGDFVLHFLVLFFSSHRFFLFCFQHPSVFSHHYSCCSSWCSCLWGCSLRPAILTWARISYPLQHCSPFPLWIPVPWLPGRVEPCSVCSIFRWFIRGF